jgi:hypothetical protein
LDKLPDIRKMDMTFGTWNVRSMYRAGLLMTVAKEILKCKLDLMGQRSTEPAGKYAFFYG